MVFSHTVDLLIDNTVSDSDKSGSLCVWVHEAGEEQLSVENKYGELLRDWE